MPKEEEKPDITRPQFILGIDVGGTTIKYQLFQLKDGALTPAAGHEKEQAQDTQTGFKAHTQQVADIVTHIATEAERMRGELVGIGIGSPGRFDDKGCMKPGTNPSIQTPGRDDFAGINLRGAYLSKLPEALRKRFMVKEKDAFVVRNDGDAAALGIMDGIKKGTITQLADQDGNEFNAESVKGNHVAYLGIGTGVGHAIIYVDANGTTQFKTDGHASKLWIDVPPDDIAKVKDAKEKWNKIPGVNKIDIVVDKEKGRVRAEDLLRFPILCGMADVSRGSNLSPDVAEHQEALKFAGKYTAKLIAVIRSGQSEDVNGEAQGWTAEDKAQAARTSDYLIGGGILKDAPLAKIMIDAANDELKTLGATHTNEQDMTKPIRLVAYSGTNRALEAAAGLAMTGLQKQKS